MLHHLDKQRGTLLSKAFVATSDGEMPIKRILTWSGSEGENVVWPEPATHLRITSNYDDSPSTRAEEGKPYGHPIINPDSPTYSPLEVTVVPYPREAGWKLEGENFDLGGEEGAPHYGPATLTFEVSKPDIIGYKLHRITVKPEYGDAEPIALSFWSVKFSESTLTPSHWWSFDGENLTDSVGGIDLIKVNPTAPTEFVDGVTRRAIRATFVDGAANPNVYLVNMTPEYGTKGMSVSAFGRFGRGGRVGFFDQEEQNYTKGSHFGFQWFYRQPVLLSLLSASGTVPPTSAADRMVSGVWHHIAATCTPPLDPYTHEDFTVDFTSNEFGTITYTSPNVAYSRTWDSTVFVDFFTYTFRLLKLYVDGVLKGEVIAYLRPNQADVLPGRGVFEVSMLNEYDQGEVNYDVIDEVKTFDKELTLSEIRGECALIGLQFLNDSPTGETEAPPVWISRNPRTRTPPADIDEVPLDCHLKVFLIDNQTLAVGGVFREFFIDRLGTEFPNMDAVELNHRNGFTENWLRDFYYRYNMWDLYRDYQPRIVAGMDDAASWSCDAGPVSLIGRWQNSTGTMRFDDVYDGANFVELDNADIVHFGYLRLPTPMTEGSTHTITWNGNTVEFTYGRERYVSSIKVNQEGYLPEAGRKYAYLGLWLGTGGAYQLPPSATSFHVVPVGSDTPVFTGAPSPRGTATTHTRYEVTYQLTGEDTYVCDFSALQTEGDYQIYVPGVGYSHVFKIGQAAIGKAFWTHARGLFHHRSGCSNVVKPYTNWEYPKPAHYWTWESKFICDDTTYDQCVTPDGGTYSAIFPSKHFSMIPNNVTGKLFRDLRGGWYDAADFDRRTYHFTVVRDLVEAYLRFPQNFTDGQLDLPESGNGIPDILSEAEWGLDVWRRGQREDGGIAAWIESDGHESDWPWRSSKRYYIGLANRKDSLDYAQCAAKFARALRMVGTPAALAKADVYTESAIRAFNFGAPAANAATLQFTQSNAANTFNFSYTEPDSPAKQRIVRTAAALFVLTGEPRFAKEITPENFEFYYESLRLNENTFSQECATELLFDLDDYFPEHATRMKDFIMSKANQWLGYQELQTYHEMTWPPNHGFYNFLSWGTGHPETRGRSFIYAWLLTGDPSWRDAALIIMDNVAGCNAMGRCLTTGLGKVSPANYLDSWLPRAEHELKVYEPVPGITPYSFIGDLSGSATSYGFCLYKAGRGDMGFVELTKNILPGGYSTSVANTRGSVAVWLQSNWPLWRNIFEMGGMIVPQSEFAIAETISGKVFMTGCLMGSGFSPDAAWKARTPSKDRYAVEGRVFLP